MLLQCMLSFTKAFIIQSAPILTNSACHTSQHLSLCIQCMQKLKITNTVCKGYANVHLDKFTEYISFCIDNILNW